MNPNDYKKQKERALSRKMELISIKGGKCEICGYDKNIAALEFHHINPEEKELPLDSRHLSNTSTVKIMEELEKCVLVCANCHREIHNPEFAKENIAILTEQRTSKHIPVAKNKKHYCKNCGNEIENYTSGKKYCSKECREADTNKTMLEYNDLVKKYNELKSWEKVAKHFGTTRRVIQRIRRLNE
jgi:hypothetical protein